MSQHHRIPAQEIDNLSEQPKSQLIGVRRSSNKRLVSGTGPTQTEISMQQQPALRQSQRASDCQWKQFDIQVQPKAEGNQNAPYHGQSQQRTSLEKYEALQLSIQQLLRSQRSERPRMSPQIYNKLKETQEILKKNKLQFKRKQPSKQTKIDLKTRCNQDKAVGSKNRDPFNGLSPSVGCYQGLTSQVQKNPIESLKQNQARKQKIFETFSTFQQNKKTQSLQFDKKQASRPQQQTVYKELSHYFCQPTTHAQTKNPKSSQSNLQQSWLIPISHNSLGELQQTAQNLPTKKKAQKHISFKAQNCLQQKGSSSEKSLKLACNNKKNPYAREYRLNQQKSNEPDNFKQTPQLINNYSEPPLSSAFNMQYQKFPSKQQRLKAQKLLLSNSIATPQLQSKPQQKQIEIFTFNRLAQTQLMAASNSINNRTAKNNQQNLLQLTDPSFRQLPKCNSSLYEQKQPTTMMADHRIDKLSPLSSLNLRPQLLKEPSQINASSYPKILNPQPIRTAVPNLYKPSVPYAPWQSEVQPDSKKIITTTSLNISNQQLMQFENCIEINRKPYQKINKSPNKTLQNPTQPELPIRKNSLNINFQQIQSFFSKREEKHFLPQKAQQKQRREANSLSRQNIKSTPQTVKQNFPTCTVQNELNPKLTYRIQNPSNEIQQKQETIAQLSQKKTKTQSHKNDEVILLDRQEDPLNIKITDCAQKARQTQIHNTGFQESQINPIKVKIFDGQLITQSTKTIEPNQPQKIKLIQRQPSPIDNIQRQQSPFKTIQWQPGPIVKVIQKNIRPVNIQRQMSPINAKIQRQPIEIQSNPFNFNVIKRQLGPIVRQSSPFNDNIAQRQPSPIQRHSQSQLSPINRNILQRLPSPSERQLFKEFKMQPSPTTIVIQRQPHAFRQFNIQPSIINKKIIQRQQSPIQRQSFKVFQSKPNPTKIIVQRQPSPIQRHQSPVNVKIIPSPIKMQTSPNNIVQRQSSPINYKVIERQQSPINALKQPSPLKLQRLQNQYSPIQQIKRKSNILNGQLISNQQISIKALANSPFQTRRPDQQHSDSFVPVQRQYMNARQSKDERPQQKQFSIQRQLFAGQKQPNPAAVVYASYRQSSPYQSKNDKRDASPVKLSIPMLYRRVQSVERFISQPQPKPNQACFKQTARVVKPPVQYSSPLPTSLVQHTVISQKREHSSLQFLNAKLQYQKPKEIKAKQFKIESTLILSLNQPRQAKQPKERQLIQQAEEEIQFQSPCLEKALQRSKIKSVQYQARLNKTPFDNQSCELSYVKSNKKSVISKDSKVVKKQSLPDELRQPQTRSKKIALQTELLGKQKARQSSQLLLSQPRSKKQSTQSGQRLNNWAYMKSGGQLLGLLVRSGGEKGRELHRIATRIEKLPLKSEEQEFNSQSQVRSVTSEQIMQKYKPFMRKDKSIHYSVDL